MRSPFLRVIVLCLLLGSCARRSALDSAEVLHRTVQRSQQLQSARLRVEATVTTPSATITVAGEGTIVNGGRQTAFTGTVNGPGIAVEGDVVSEFQRDLYVRISNFTASGQNAPQELINVWWRLRGTGSTLPPPSVAPDPWFLRSQAAAVDVTKDRGIEQLDGEDVYAYDVAVREMELFNLLEQAARDRGETVDREDLERQWERYDLRGTLWIDADDFLIRKLEWELRSRPDDGAAMEVVLKADVLDHDRAAAPAVPVDARPLPAGSLLELLQSPSFLPVLP